MYFHLNSFYGNFDKVLNLKTIRRNTCTFFLTLQGQADFHDFSTVDFNFNCIIKSMFIHLCNGFKHASQCRFQMLNLHKVLKTLIFSLLGLVNFRYPQCSIEKYKQNLWISQIQIQSESELIFFFLIFLGSVYFFGKQLLRQLGMKIPPKITKSAKITETF